METMKLSEVRLLFGVLLAAPLSLAVLGFDVWIAFDFVRQARSTHYPTVPGTITRSEVRMLRTGGRTHTSYPSYELRFAYAVDGRPYEGKRLRFYTGSATAEPGQQARHLRVNDTVPVFYRPADPTDAILQPGVNGADVLALMYPALFNVLALFLWSLVGAMRSDGSTVPAFEREGRTHVTLPPLPPSAIGLLASGVGLIIGCGVAFNGTPLSVTGALGWWAAVVAVGGAAAAVQRFRVRSGACDVILDERARELSLPPVAGRWRRLHVPWSQVVSVTVETRGQQKKAYRPVLEFKDARGAFHREPIGGWSIYLERSEPLVDWLRARLKLGERRPG